MKIGIARENRPKEKRVIIQPSEINKIAVGHEVIVEKEAGLGIDIPDGCNDTGFFWGKPCQ